MRGISSRSGKKPLHRHFTQEFRDVKTRFGRNYLCMAHWTNGISYQTFNLGLRVRLPYASPYEVSERTVTFSQLKLVGFKYSSEVQFFRHFLTYLLPVDLASLDVNLQVAI